MIKILGLISVLAASTYSSSTVGSTRRSVPPTHELAALKVTPNYLPLTRRHNVPTISDTSAPSVINLKGPGHGRLLFGTSILVFNVKVTIAGQDFELLLDGTSSDTWVVTEGFTCLNGTDQEISEASCDFGPTLQGDYATRTVKNRNFNLTYPNEASFYGDFAKLDITLAGIHVKNQMVGLVDLVQIPGPVLDNITSGILGMAYSSVTSAFIGNNGTLDNRTIGTAPGDRSPYSAIFETMATEGLTPALWSLALERPKPNYGLSSPGGYIAFGGLPPVAFDPIFSSTPIEIYISPVPLPETSATNFSSYTITPNGYAFNNKAGNFTHHANKHPTIVDPLTFNIFAPSNVFAAYVATIQPPPKMKHGFPFVLCNATVPNFGVDIGGIIFNITTPDLMQPYINFTSSNGGEYCVIAIADAAEPGTTGGAVQQAVLGAPFLQSVVAVFDVGASMMRFAAHHY